MGSGIAQVAAQAGHAVVVYDTRKEALNHCQAQLKKTFDRLVEKGRVSATEAQEIVSRVAYSDSLTPMRGCGLVIEAIIEKPDAKKSVFEALETLVAPDAILATNTSSLSIAGLSAGLKHPERFLGIHFFNPAPLMPLVEIIPGVATHPEVNNRATNLIQSWGKTTVACKDTPGFIVNRVARPFYSESIKMMEEGLADAATIDWALKEKGGFRMGPFELMDLIGHDVNYVVTETVWTQFFYDPRFKPSISQKRLLEAGWLGRKTGRGFYDHRPEATPPKPTQDEPLAEKITQRVVAMLINEAADAMLHSICSEADLEMAMTKGVNYPKGLLSWGQELGWSAVLQTLEELHGWYGDDRYRPNPWLKRKAHG